VEAGAAAPASEVRRGHSSFLSIKEVKRGHSSFSTIKMNAAFIP
jgi:hypothetical protein